MAVRGTVSKTNSGQKPWTSMDADLAFLGNFTTLRAGQVRIEQQANAKLKWTLTLSPSGVESYQGEDQ